MTAIPVLAPTSLPDQSETPELKLAGEFFQPYDRPGALKRPGFGWKGEVLGVPADEESEALRRPKTWKDIRSLDRVLGNPDPFRSEATAEQKLDRTQRVREIRDSAERTPVTKRFSLDQYTVPIRDLPAALEGTTLLHVSDIHFNEKWSRPVREILRLSQKLDQLKISPDVLAVTGDIITDTPKDLHRVALRSMERLAERCGIACFVPGNHDYYGNGIEYVRRAMSTIGYTDLTNTTVPVKITNGGSAGLVTLSGVDDHLEGSPETPEPLMLNGDVNLLLSHNLDAVRSNFPDSFDVIMAGHLHAGEWPLGEMVMRATGYSENLNKLVSGWGALTDRALAHVSPGLARHFGSFPGVSKPSVALMTLTRAER